MTENAGAFRHASRRPRLGQNNEANAPAATLIFMSVAAHDRRARFIGTAKRTGKAEKGLACGPRDSPLSLAPRR